MSLCPLELHVNSRSILNFTVRSLTIARLFHQIFRYCFFFFRSLFEYNINKSVTGQTYANQCITHMRVYLETKSRARDLATSFGSLADCCFGVTVLFGLLVFGRFQIGWFLLLLSILSESQKLC